MIAADDIGVCDRATASCAAPSSDFDRVTAPP